MDAKRIAAMAQAEASKQADALTAPKLTFELRRIQRHELSQKLIDQAVNVLNETRGKPLGAEVSFELDGKGYVGRTELHYREPGDSSSKPTGFHRGVSMFVAERVS